MVQSLVCGFIVLSFGENRGKPKENQTGKIHFPMLRVRSASFGNVRMRISNDNKRENRKLCRTLSPNCVHLFRLGSNGFLLSRGRLYKALNYVLTTQKVVKLKLTLTT